MDEIHKSFIKKNWRWDDPSTVKVAANLAANGIAIEDLRVLLDLTDEELNEKFHTYPEFKIAYDMGPKYLEYQMKAKLTDQALNGNVQAQQTLLTMQRTMKYDDQVELVDILDKIEKATDSREMSLAMQKMVHKQAAIAAASGTMKPGELVRLAALTADRVDGKVADKVELSGSVGISHILNEIMDQEFSLPKPEWFDKTKVIDHTSVEAAVVSSTTFEGDINNVKL